MGNEFVFKRSISDEQIIISLKQKNLYKDKLLKDITDVKRIKGLKEKSKKDKDARREYLSVKRNFVFPAIRKEGIYFYYYDSLLFKYTYEGKFYTHPKYAFVPKEYGAEYVTDKCDDKKIANFEDGYKNIKEKAKLYTSVEAEGVHHICRNGNFFTNDKYIVLDIEVAFEKSKKDKKSLKEKEESKRGDKQDRIDLLLYDIENKELLFVEAKDYTNDEIAPKDKPKVVNQIERYNNILKKLENREIILNEYKKYVQNINEIFKNELPKQLPIPEKLCQESGLVIFGFDGDQGRGRLKKIKEKLKKHKVKFYCYGNTNKIEIKTLYTKIRKKIRN